MRRPTHRAARSRQRVFGGLGALAVLGFFMPSAAPALAEGEGNEGDVDVVNTETVQVYTDATGEVQSQRIYEQLTLTGNGSVDLLNPVETDGLRNLDGFSGVDVSDGTQRVSMDVDGVDRWRTVSDYDGDVPLEVGVTYLLDGEEVDPSDVVGASGELEVAYLVRNITAQEQDITYTDGSGGTLTSTAEVPVPIVGSLTVTAPSTFTDVQSEQANLAGDGKGGTRMSFTMTLFPPLGSDTAEFGYTAQITDGVVPRADISALPVNPLESPTFQTAATSYESGSQTGERLAAGATEIDTNLLRLRDGASDLLAGLIQLRAGSGQLAEGLTEDAAPGAQQLADGAGRLSDGTGELVSGTGRLQGGASQLSDGAGRLEDGASQLSDGAGRLEDGASQLSDGAGRLEDGASQLADGTGRLQSGAGELADGASALDGGLDQLGSGVGDLDSGATDLAAGQQALADGLTQLYRGVEQLPSDVRAQLAADPDYAALLGSLSRIAAGIGSATDGPAAVTLMGGLQRLQLGLDNPAAAGACATDPTQCGAANALDLISQRLSGALAAPASVPGTVAALKQSILNIGSVPACSSDPQCAGTVLATANGVEQAQTQSLTELRAGVVQVAGGIRQRITGPGAGLDQIRAALTTGVDPTTCRANASACGIKEAALFLNQVGIPLLVDGLTTSISSELLANIGQPAPGCDPQTTIRCAAAALADGGTQLTSGVDDLVAGVQQLGEGGALLASGADQLADGALDLDDGASRVAEGTGDLADGASRLADGTSDLDAGAERLADGTGDLADGANRLADGTTDLDAGAARLDDGAGQLSDGAADLADGLGDAADGSQRLNDGLGEAADGAPQLVDGADRLSTEGLSKLIAAGEDTAQDYGELYAIIAAGAERADSERMAFGAPEGATGLTAYTFVVQGEDGEGGRNVARAVGALGLGLLGLGAFGLRRRLFA